MKTTLLAAALLPLLALAKKPDCTTSTITIQPPCAAPPPTTKPHCPTCTVTSEQKAPCVHTDPCNSRKTATTSVIAQCPTYNSCGRQCSTVVLVDTPIPCTKASS